ncbi:NLR family member X1 isoform X2 [Latimeria chalumnae]|uniref:NLR family member X1 isoform X2 n=1 Tax=Latimeria chalumnae TaxID=7897 RepID=UPI00313EBFDC
MHCWKCLPRPRIEWTSERRLQLISCRMWNPGAEGLPCISGVLSTPNVKAFSALVSIKSPGKREPEFRKTSFRTALRYEGRLFTTDSVTDSLNEHRKRLREWFSHLPSEEKQFGATFSAETMHVDPMIKERSPDQLFSGPIQWQRQDLSANKAIKLEELFPVLQQAAGGRVRNIVLYGAVGTGKSSCTKKLVLDWCAGGLTQFKLVIPFSCEDLSQQSRPISLNRLIAKKYLHLRGIIPLLGSGAMKDVLFVFNDLEQIKLNFRLASTELCSDPEEQVLPSALVVNLLRKYLLPEATILVTTRPSALDKIPSKYVGLCAQICGFPNLEQQKMYFTRRLYQSQGNADEAIDLVKMLYLNLKRQNQLTVTCFLPSYCWLICATLHFLHFTNSSTPIRTLTGIYTSFLRLNFGGEILDLATPEGTSLMRYVAKTVGKLAYEGIKQKKTSFSEEDLRDSIEMETKTDEELNRVNVFKSDVMDFFITPCVQSSEDLQYVFTVPAMQEYLAALFIVLGERKTTLDRVGNEVSEAIGKVTEDLTAVLNILSRFLPLRVFTFINLVNMFPHFYGKLSGKNKRRIAHTMVVEMFKKEDEFNDDVLEQINSSILGVESPPHGQDKSSESKSFELFPIFMSGLLSHRNRALLDQLGCTIKNFTVLEIAKALKKHLIERSQEKLPPPELMDLIFFLYEFQNDRFTAEIIKSFKAMDLSSVKMTPLKCFVLASVMSISSHVVEELDLSSCHLNLEGLKSLSPVFLHCRNLNLCDNPLAGTGVTILAAALERSRSLSRLSLVHTSLGNEGVGVLANHLSKNQHLEELNLAYNSITDTAALELVEVARAHPTLKQVHLYMNDISEEGKNSLYTLSQDKAGVKVLVSVAEGADISEYWPLILNIMKRNAVSWGRDRFRGQLELLLKDLKCGRQKDRNLFRKLGSWRVEKDIKQVLKTMEKKQN